MSNNQRTPRTDSLVEHHTQETAALIAGGHPQFGHAKRQAQELLDHACALEIELAATAETLAGKLIDAWVADKGRQIPWAKAVQIIAIVTKQPNEERDRLLRMGDEDGSCDMCGRNAAAEAKRALALERELRIAELKARASLANNLCPDHRDKQAGKPCLACTVETAERANADLIERCASCFNEVPNVNFIRERIRAQKGEKENQDV